MNPHTDNKIVSGIFITFAGNCKTALTFYQTCFGGTLQFETFEQELRGYTDTPVIVGSLFSESINIHGSDLIHNEGRHIGNYMSIFLHCETAFERSDLMQRLRFNSKKAVYKQSREQKLIEFTDAFDVRWILGI